jgi:hypothetical protein
MSFDFPQKFEDTKGIIRICNWRGNRQYIYQKIEDTTGVIRICNNVLSVLPSVRFKLSLWSLQTFGKCIVCSTFSYRF